MLCLSRAWITAEFIRGYSTVFVDEICRKHAKNARLLKSIAEMNVCVEQVEMKIRSKTAAASKKEPFIAVKKTPTTLELRPTATNHSKLNERPAVTRSVMKLRSKSSFKTPPEEEKAEIPRKNTISTSRILRSQNKSKNDKN